MPVNTSNQTSENNQENKIQNHKFVSWGKPIGTKDDIIRTPQLSQAHL